MLLQAVCVEKSSIETYQGDSWLQDDLQDKAKTDPKGTIRRPEQDTPKRLIDPFAIIREKTWFPVNLIGMADRRIELNTSCFLDAVIKAVAADWSCPLIVVYCELRYFENVICDESLI